MAAVCVLENWILLSVFNDAMHLLPSGILRKSRVDAISLTRMKNNAEKNIRGMVEDGKEIKINVVTLRFARFLSSSKDEEREWGRKKVPATHIIYNDVVHIGDASLIFFCPFWLYARQCVACKVRSSSTDLSITGCWSYSSSFNRINEFKCAHCKLIRFLFRLHTRNA